MVTAFGASRPTAGLFNREVSHHVTFGADLVLFSAAVYYIWKGKSGLGALVLALLAWVLVLLDPLRHMVLDHNGPEALAMYDDEDKLTTVGRVCQAATITGFICFAVAILLHRQCAQCG